MSKTCRSSPSQQVWSVALQIVPALRDLDACPDGGCWIWPSITQRSYQTAEILASLLGTGYSRIVPEYSFLDPRYASAPNLLLQLTLWQVRRTVHFLFAYAFFVNERIMQQKDSS